MSSPTLGKLYTINQEYKKLIQSRLNPVKQDSVLEEGITETVQQKRKRLFNKDTGSLQLNLKGVPFYIWDEDLHYKLRQTTDNACCFVDMLGRPTNPKTGEEMPLFPYEYEVVKALVNDSYLNPNNDPRRYKHLWIKKGRGAGITEFFIYFMLYLPCCYPEVYYDSQMAIVTGIRKQTAVVVMERMKHKLYQKLNITTDFNVNVLDINGCIIQAYPAKYPDSYRGLHNLKVLFFDEADYTPLSIIDDTFANAEGFFAKNNPYVIFNSTAHRPGGLMQRIEEQKDDECNYKKLYILADKLVGYIYTQEELELASTSPYYRQEYWGEYKGERGNLFPQEYLDYAAGLTDTLIIRDMESGDIRKTIQRPVGELTIRDIISDHRYLGVGFDTSIGTDPAFNSSIFASVVAKEIAGIIYIIKEKGLQSPSIDDGIELQKRFLYNDYPTYHPKIWIDGSAVPFIRSLKQDLGEDPDYHNYNPDLLREMMNGQMGMIVCPINFNKYGDKMNYHLRRLMELGRIRIDKEVTPNTWVSWNSAKFDEVHGKFNKKETAYNDFFDASRLLCCNYKIGNIGII